ncbi:unnamed protein product [Gongylonema pulchrum]|uniref:Uncharacterized protein n=1 Tax=Gongylonema pulchrum TaxID=637853 RepID=A0A3P7PGV3_9BILA|nr:unnamed protein product [Gongylonema pulchrum]
MLCRRASAILPHYRYKSNYSLRVLPRFEEDEEKQEEEVRSKYMFRPRLSAIAENDRFDVPFQNEYEQCCREDYDWDSEFQTIKTVWERLKPPPQEKVEEKVLTIGNSRSLPWAPITVQLLKMLRKLPNSRVGILGMAHNFEQKTLMARTRKLFELVCQTYYTGDLKNLIESDENAEPIVEHMPEVEKLQADVRELLNVTEQDIITIAPGTYGALQDFFRVFFASTYSLSITCCAAYRKNLSIPYNYGYNVPHLVFGSFGYWYSKKSNRFELHDLHILGFPVLPWYRDLPATDGKFFSPKYEYVRQPSSMLFPFS